MRASVQTYAGFFPAHRPGIVFTHLVDAQSKQADLGRELTRRAMPKFSMQVGFIVKVRHDTLR